MPHHSQATAYSSASDMYSAVPSNPSRGFSSAQGTVVETESQLPSDPSEAPVVHTGSLESKSNKVAHPPLLYPPKYQPDAVPTYASAPGACEKGKHVVQARVAVMWSGADMAACKVFPYQ